MFNSNVSARILGIGSIADAERLRLSGLIERNGFVGLRRECHDTFEIESHSNSIPKVRMAEQVAHLILRSLTLCPSRTTPSASETTGSCFDQT